MSRRPRPNLRVTTEATPPIEILAPPRNLDTRATITIDDKTFEVEAEDLVKIADLGRGAYGVVEKMKHIKTDTVIAVKRITATVNTQEQVRNLKSWSSKRLHNHFPQKRLLMDLDISMRSSDCPFTVHFYGALFREGDVWICMEVMECSLDKFYPIVFKNERQMPEGDWTTIESVVRL